MTDLTLEQAIKILNFMKTLKTPEAEEMIIMLNDALGYYGD